MRTLLSPHLSFLLNIPTTQPCSLKLLPADLAISAMDAQWTWQLLSLNAGPRQLTAPSPLSTSRQPSPRLFFTRHLGRSMINGQRQIRVCYSNPQFVGINFGVVYATLLSVRISNHQWIRCQSQSVTTQFFCGTVDLRYMRSLT